MSAAPGDGSSDFGPYVAYLEEHGKPATELNEEVGLRVGEWRFFWRGQPGRRADAVAIDASGRTLDGFGPGDWFEFLTEPGLDADTAHRRAVWLLLRPAAVGPSHPLKDPEIAELVVAPSILRDEDEVSLEGWMVFPPETEEPFRLRVEAHRGAPTTITSELWEDVKERAE